jgi:hypothetical protein
MLARGASLSLSTTGIWKFWALEEDVESKYSLPWGSYVFSMKKQSRPLVKAALL